MSLQNSSSTGIEFTSKRLPNLFLSHTLILVGKQQGDACLGAIDIGGTKIRVACLDSNLTVVSVNEFPTAAASSPTAALDRASEFFSGLRLDAIGVGCTGPVDPISGTVGDVELLPGWQGFPLTKYLEDRFAAPAILENDCDAAALGESVHANNSSRLLYVSLSTGIGAGIVIDSKLYRGHQGAHPELGHMVLDPAGPLCYCGARGCWESLASGPALARSHGSAIDAREVFTLARQKDPRALAALEKFRAYTAQGLGNLVTLFAPETIVVGGGLMNAAPYFFPEVVAQATAQAGLVASVSTRIRAAALGPDAVLVGAAFAAQQLLALKDPAPCTPA